MPEYKHASDYLLGLANGPNIPGWLSDLIVRILEKDGELEDAVIAPAAEQLIAKSSRSLSSISSTKRKRRIWIRRCNSLHRKTLFLQIRQTSLMNVIDNNKD